MGLTSFTGELVMYVAILAGVVEALNIEPGIDLFADALNDCTPDKYCCVNREKGEKIPGGPSCFFREQSILYFICWSPKGSMTSEILVELIVELDIREFVNRSNNSIKPFLLLDGHDSRLKISFLQYINNPATEWCVCLGVAYCTSYWQVGSSKQQNGSYKIALNKAKQELVRKKEKFGLKATIEKTDIMIILNNAWRGSFACTKKIKNQ